MNTSFDFSGLLADFDPDTPNQHAFWNDPYISACMLQAHLDPDHDAASRQPRHIRATLDWILGRPAFRDRPGPLDVLDLGCGPGLYARELARAGHRVTGVDLSPRSIAHARATAATDGLAIDYRCANYLELDDLPAFDLVMMIYCDLGALTRAERALMLARMKAWLKPGGRLVFDVWGMDLPGTLPDRREWSWQESGFWAPGPHLVLEERRNHPDRGVIARRVVVLEAAAAAPRAYFLRDYYFSEAGLRAELASAGCASAETAADVVVQEDFVQAAPWFVCAG